MSSLPIPADETLAGSGSGVGARREWVIPRGAVFVHPDTIHVLLCGDEQTRARVTAVLSVESETQESPGLIRVPAVACLCGRVVA